MSQTPIEPEYIRREGKQGRLKTRVIAIVVEGNRTRLYLPAEVDSGRDEDDLEPTWVPDGEMFGDSRAFTPSIYGLGKWKDIFTKRQLVALGTLYSTIAEIKQDIAKDALDAGWAKDGTAADRYANVVAVYLCLATSRWSDFFEHDMRMECRQPKREKHVRAAGNSHVVGFC